MNRFDNIVVELVNNNDQLHEALKLRWEAFKTYFPDQKKFDFSFWNESFDVESNSKLFLAKKEGIPCGSVRLQINEGLGVEIDNYIKINGVINSTEAKYAQASRLSVTEKNSSTVFLAILKTLWLFCLKNEIGTIFCSAKQEHGKLYEKLLFTDLGNPGTFIHPWTRKINRTYYMKIDRRPYTKNKHFLHDYFVPS